MIRRPIILFLLLGLSSPAPAQMPTEPPPTDPAKLKEWVEKFQRAVQQKQAEAAQAAQAASAAAADRHPLKIAPPPRDDAELRRLPAVPLTAETVPAELDRIVRALRAGLERDEVADVDRALARYPGDSKALANAAAIAWVQRAPGSALLVAAEAARARPEDVNALNTLGALLVQAGYGHKGIPLLQYLVTRHPEDPTLLNNLGQAWFNLGALEQAEPLLVRCLGRAPKYGAAHVALGIIAQARGDTAGANAHFQAAAESDYSPAARQALDHAKISYHLPPGFVQMLAKGEYFNPTHFVPPRPQRRGEEGKMKEREMEAFRDYVGGKIDLLKAQFAAANAEAQKLAATHPMEAIMSASRASIFSGMALREITTARLEGQDVIDAAIRHYKDGVAELKAKRDAQIQKINDDAAAAPSGEGGDTNPCPARKAVVDAYLTACADRFEEMEAVVLPRYRLRVNTIMTYLPLVAAGAPYRAEFASEAKEYLDKVEELAGKEVTEDMTCSAPPVGGSGQKPEGEIPRLGDCPVHVSVDIYVATIKADCRNLGFEFKAGLEFSATKDFVSGETTLTAGLGEDVKGIEGSAEFVVTWDRNNNLSFVGVQMEAGASLPGIPGVETPEVHLAKDVTATAGTSSIAPNLSEVKASTTLGVSIGPAGLTPQLEGGVAADVLGRDLFEARI